jgi:phosphomannomutase
MPLTLPPDLMVSVSGFRGRVGQSLTPELVCGLAASFGAFLGDEGAEGPIYLGRDSRTSGAMFADAVRAGLVSVGRTVVELGVVPTPTLLLAAREGAAAGAIGVTASHNPAEWNALKLVGPDGLFLDVERMGRFRTALAAGEPARRPWDALGGVREDREALSRHVARILELRHLEPERLRARAFHVALDCVHGAGALVLTPLLEALGCTVTGIGLEPDGRFPRDPEPTAANLADLGELVRSSGAELGFAVDPDGDRLSLVDGAGLALGEDLTLALCVATVLRREEGPVVTNLSTSQVVEDVARARGAPIFRTPVGEINVARRMQKEGAVIGGEGNGGVIVPDLQLTRDASAGAALVLQHLLDEGVSLREAANRWPNYCIVKRKTGFPREKISEAYGALSAGLPGAELDSSDGLRLAWPDRREWLHVRPSGTEPVVRLIAEAPEPGAAEVLVARADELLPR